MNVATHPTRSAYGEAEWQLRCDLAALYRLVAHHRMTDLIYTHISVRLPGPEHHFLINRYGVLFEHMRASDLVKIGVDGEIVGDEATPQSEVNAAGFTIHSAIHIARPDIACVIHTHTAAGIAVSAQKHGLLPISQHSLMFHGNLAYHGYEGIALNLEERDRIIADLGPHKAMILRNHGLLVGGESIPEAWMRIYYLERACQAQVAALAGGAELIEPPEQVKQLTAMQYSMAGPTGQFERLWNASLRLIEDGEPDYRS